LLPDAPVPDGRTVLTGLDATGVRPDMGHGRHLRSFIRDTNPLERFNREIGRRTDVVGIFPGDQSLIRLASMLAIEQNDEWLVGRRYLSAASMGPLIEERPHRHSDQEVLELQPG
jgi:transposase-like protein